MQEAVSAHQSLLPELRSALSTLENEEMREPLTRLVAQLEDPEKLAESFAAYTQPDGSVLIEISPEAERLLDYGVPDERSLDEIRRAHDILGGLLKEEWLAHRLLPPPIYVRVEAAMNVLCWVLNHQNENFTQLLAAVEQRLERARMKVVNGESDV